MRRFHARLTAAGGGAVALATLAWLLTSAAPAAGAAPRGAVAPAVRAPRLPSQGPETRPTLPAPVAVAAVETKSALHPPADAPLADRVADLVRRIREVPGRNPALPPDLLADLLAFVAAGDEARDALFVAAWSPETPGVVRGRIQLSFMALGDPSLRDELLAAWKACDPAAPARADMAARDHDDLARWIDAPTGSDPVDRTRRLRAIPVESLSQPAVAAALLRAARAETDRDARSTVYHLLAWGGVAEAIPLLLETAADAGREVRDRADAAYALSQHRGRVDVTAVLDVYHRSPPEVRAHLLSRLADFPASSGAIDALLSALEDDAYHGRLRTAAAEGLHRVLHALRERDAIDLGHRTATILRRMEEGAAGTVLNLLADVLPKNPPLREAAQDLYRASASGSALREAVAASPILRRGAGL